MAHGGTAGIQKRTDHGKRAHGTDKAVRKQRGREQNNRWQRAKEETDAARAALDAIIEEQKISPALGVTAGALIDARKKQAEELLAQREAEQQKIEVAEAEAQAAKPAPKPKVPKVLWQDPEPTVSETGLPMYAPLFKFEREFSPDRMPQEGDGAFDFAVTMAIRRLKLGYHLEAVLKDYGIGVKDLPEGLFDELGWGIRPDYVEEI